jgi:MerR family copper efflux transcriptional regulator
MSALSIGEVAKAAELPIDTIRYYEKAGLIPPPQRRESGYRIYTGETVSRLRFIRRAKELGFTLAEITELLDLSAQGAQDMGRMRDAAQQKLAMVEDKLRELERMRAALRQLVEACPGHGALAECPIVQALSGERAAGRPGAGA